MTGTANPSSAVSVANRLRPVLLRLARELRREARAFGVTGGQAALLAARAEIELTVEGQRVLRRVRSHRTAWLAARLDQLGPSELATIDAAIEPLAALTAGP